MAGARARRLLADIAAVALGRGAAAVVTFAALPVVVAYAGTEAYGLYVLVLTVSGYFALLDFGVGTAVTRLIAERHAQGDAPGIARVIATAVLHHAGVGLVVAAALVTLATFGDRVLDVDGALRDTGRRLLLVGAGAALLTWPTSIIRAVAEGLQRFHAVAAVGAGFQAAGTLAGVAALAAGAGIEAVLALSALATVSGNLALATVVRRTLPALRVGWRAADRATLRAIVRFSAWMFLGSVSSVAIFQLDHLIVAAFTSVGAVAVYHVAWTLLGAVKMLDNLVKGPPWIAGAELAGRGDRDGQQRLVLQGTRYVAGLFLPLVVVVIVFAAPLIRHWMGPGFADAVLPARVLLAGWIVVSLWEVGAGVVTASGRVARLTLIALLGAALNVALSVALVRPLGLVGVALGTAIPTVLVAPLVWRTIVVTLDLRAARLLRACAAGLVPTLVAAGVAAGLRAAAPPASLVATLLEMGIAFSAAGAAAWATALSRDDRALVRAVVTRA